MRCKVILLVLVCVMLGIGMILVIHGTIFKTRWGINSASEFECPRCHKVHPTTRQPANQRQSLWGGLTCDACGLEVDKWNRPLSI
jgi:hypothetical protein